MRRGTMTLTAVIAALLVACTATGSPDSTRGGEPEAGVVSTAVSTTGASATTVPTSVYPASTTTATSTTGVPAASTTGVSATTTTGVLATTTQPTPVAPAGGYVVEDPNYFPEPLQPGSEYLGSGCTPGAGPLPDGIWYGSLENVKSDSFDFDLMCVAPNPPGSTEEDGLADITNSNPALRTVPVDADARVHFVDAMEHEVVSEYGTWAAAPTLGNGCTLETCGLEGWVYVNGGKATEIVMVWTP